MCCPSLAVSRTCVLPSAYSMHFPLLRCFPKLQYGFTSIHYHPVSHILRPALCHSKSHCLFTTHQTNVCHYRMVRWISGQLRPHTTLPGLSLNSSLHPPALQDHTRYLPSVLCCIGWKMHQIPGRNIISWLTQILSPRHLCAS